MGEGFWVVLGTTIGTVGSLATTWLNAYFARRSKYPEYDKAVEKLLKDMLEHGPKWRKIETLMRVTGLNEQDTKEYLITLGARGSESDGDLWGLTSRNPLQQIATSN
jgi:hypothetical protein